MVLRRLQRADSRLGRTARAAVTLALTDRAQAQDRQRRQRQRRQLTVKVHVKVRHRLRRRLAGLRVGGDHLVTDLHILNGLRRAIRHEHRRVPIEAVLADPWQSHSKRARSASFHSSSPAASPTQGHFKETNPNFDGGTKGNVHALAAASPRK